MNNSPRYWIYEHDEDGEFEQELYAPNLSSAIQAAISLFNRETWNVKHSVHIVDQEMDSTTIWVAGACTLGNEHS